MRHSCVHVGLLEAGRSPTLKGLLLFRRARVSMRLGGSDNGLGEAIGTLASVSLDMCLLDKLGPWGDKAVAILVVKKVLQLRCGCFKSLVH